MRKRVISVLLLVVAGVQTSLGQGNSEGYPIEAIHCENVPQENQEMTERFFANPVDEKEAEKRASNFLSRLTISLGESTAPKRTESLKLVHQVQMTNDQTAFYVFNRERGGFVIVSADDCAEPILGYSDHGAFDVDYIPEGLKDLLAVYEGQISKAIKEQKPMAKRRVSSTRIDINPLIETRWNQGTPFNNLCPIDPNDGERCITGCVATAFAQIMYYYKWPESGRNVISYDWRGQTLSEDLSTFHFDWDKMRLTYDGDIPDEYNAVARLMYAVALGCWSDFGIEDTTGFFDKDMLHRNFYYKNNMYYLYFNDNNCNDIENVIYNDLSNNRPVLFLSEVSGYEGWRHAMVIDGFKKEDDMFHFNLGWSGFYDGYYKLSAVNAFGNGNYDSPICIIYNIEPDYNIPTVTVTDLTLGTDVMMLNEGEEINLAYTYTPNNADVATITWTSSDENVAIVKGDGLVTAVGEGTCYITASYNNDKTQPCRVIVGNVSDSSDGHDYVDLGLPSGTLWATTNIGAKSVEDFGNYFMWGETDLHRVEMEEFDWDTYDFFDAGVTKYCYETKEWAGEGEPDGLLILEDADDAAYVQWGAYWHMPSPAQFGELIDNQFTTIEQVSVNGVIGYLVTSRINGKCIFLPAASFYTNSYCNTNVINAYYWSNELAQSVYGTTAYALRLSPSEITSMKEFLRVDGLPIRPVYSERMNKDIVTVYPTELNFGTVATGESRTLEINVRNNSFESQKISPFGLDAAGFSLDWAGGELQPNTTQVVKVTYSPTMEMVASGGCFSIGTQEGSTMVSVVAASHKNSGELTTKRNLVVWGIDSTQTIYQLNELPIVKIGNGTLTISGSFASAEYKFSDVLKLTYEETVTGIKEIKVNEKRPFNQTSESLVFFSEQTDLHVAIVSMGGMIVRRFTVQKGISESISLSHLPSGVYIISINNISYKITKR